MAKKTALGRGLGALIEDSSVTNTRRPEDGVTDGIVEISIDSIETNPYQPRNYFDEEALSELAKSIEKHGIIQPITVRQLDNGMYQIISGERRFRASKLAGLETIPAYLRTANDQGMLEMALIENIQREDLDAIEVAISYQRLIDECELTQESLSEQVGKKRATIANYLRLLKLPAEVQLSIRERKLSMGHARAILGLEDIEEQVKLGKKVIEEELSVRQVEELIRKMNQPSESKKKEKEGDSADLPDSYFKLVEHLEKYFNSKINIKRNEKGEGKITINFGSDDEIADFIKKLDHLGKE
ncbi:MAG: ParB/RepB/Spo0J family partition protein [Prevotellaceae bacterium]|jgi:ParB family chromosome partitioning protein|nr:ParB/RepB/Spo0J family partition protein [Prevotellaceae bacterium]